MKRGKYCQKCNKLIFNRGNNAKYCVKCAVEIQKEWVNSGVKKNRLKIKRKKKQIIRILMKKYKTENVTAILKKVKEL